MNTETLTGQTVRDMTFHAGPHAKPVPAGSLVTFRVTAFEDDCPAMVAYLASNPRISAVIYKGAVEAV